MTAMQLRCVSWLVIAAVPLMAAGVAARAVQLAQRSRPVEGTIICGPCSEPILGGDPSAELQDTAGGSYGEDQILLAQAQDPPAKSPEPAPAKAAGESEADRLLDEAAKKLAGYEWVRAGIRQRVDLFGKRLDGTGTYLKGPNWKMKLELKIALDDRRPPSSLQQVCDGRWLWDYREVLGNRILTKIDVTAVRDLLERGPPKPGQPPSATILGLGGLEQLLRGLRDQFDFSMAGTIKVGERNFTALRGRWQRDVLVRMLPEQKADILAGKPGDLKKLPEYVPDEVLLLLDPKTLFLHRVEYRRSEVEGKEADHGEPAKGAEKSKGAKLSGKALVIMELFDVEVNQPVDELNFLYKSDLPALDRTEEYLKMLKGSEK